MSVDHIEILVEEPSMETALRLLLPKMIGDLSFEIYPYQCKQDLLPTCRTACEAIANGLLKIGALSCCWTLTMRIAGDSKTI